MTMSHTLRADGATRQTETPPIAGIRGRPSLCRPPMFGDGVPSRLKGLPHFRLRDPTGVGKNRATPWTSRAIKRR